MCIMDYDDICRQLLSEAGNWVSGEILGSSDSATANMRVRLGVPDPLAGQSQSYRIAAGRVVRHRWRKYPREIPTPIDHAALVQLIDAELARVAAETYTPKPAAPPTPLDDVAMVARQYRHQYNRWPTIPELAGRTKHKRDQVRAMVQAACDANLIQIVKGRIHPVVSAQAAAVTVSTMTFEEIAARYGPPQTTPKAPADAGPTKRRKSKIDLPSDKQFVAEAEAIVAAGGSVGDELSQRYGISVSTLWAKLGDARVREGLRRQMGTKRGRKNGAAKPRLNLPRTVSIQKILAALAAVEMPEEIRKAVLERLVA